MILLNTIIFNELTVLKRFYLRRKYKELVFLIINSLCSLAIILYWLHKRLEFSLKSTIIIYVFSPYYQLKIINLEVDYAVVFRLSLNPLYCTLFSFQNLNRITVRVFCFCFIVTSLLPEICSKHVKNRIRFVVTIKWSRYRICLKTFLKVFVYIFFTFEPI